MLQPITFLHIKRETEGQKATITRYSSQIIQYFTSYFMSQNNSSKLY